MIYTCYTIHILITLIISIYLLPTLLPLTHIGHLFHSSISLPIDQIIFHDT